MKKKNIKVIFVLLIILMLILLPTLVIKTKKVEIIKRALSYNEEKQVSALKLYSYKELNSVIQEEKTESDYNIDIDKYENIVYSKNINFEYNIANFDEKNNYQIDVLLNEKKYKNNDVKLSSGNISINLSNEGKNDIEILFFENGTEKINYHKTYYYIVPYTKQFLDEMTNKGIAVHLSPERQNGKEYYEESLNFLKILGIKKARMDLWYEGVQKRTFQSYVNYIDNAKKNDVNFLFIVNGIDSSMNNGEYISTDSDYNKFSNSINYFMNCNPTVKEYEILNEPNMNNYNTVDRAINYAKLVKKVKESSIKGTSIYSGVIADYQKSNYGKLISGPEFLKILLENDGYKYSDGISYHIYYNKGNGYLERLKQYNDIINKNGGFLKREETEYGYSTAESSEKNIQQKNIIKETIKSDLMEIDDLYLYNLKDTSDDINNKSENYGIMTYNFLPKDSFYAVKNFNQCTNGSEFIGSFTLQDDITAYVYDKDGKPKIIIWSDNGEKKIDYTDFKASDLFGNEISPDENNQITISDSPIYLDNVSTNCFYQAISNEITSGYSEFNTRFSDEISKVDSLTAKISDLNNQAISLKNASTFDENKANELMKEYFELGNMVMSAYENGKLNVEYVKLSSILDALNTIGNSYEDLITVSAKTRITDLSNITNEVNTAKSLAQDNEKFDIVYPNKIYKFAQDLLDTSSYVLGLEEENDIKTGLINSKALHAEYLAEWSQEFSKIYMKDALKDSLNKIIASNQNIKQNYSNVLLNNEISQNYKDLNNSIKEISDNIEKCNSEKINTIYNEQVELVKLIVEKYYSNEIKIDNNSFATLIKNMIGTLSEYENLYNYYTFEDNISDDDLVNTLNSVINRYNDNRDIDLSMENEIINKLSETYQNINSIEDETIKYFNKLNIKETCEIVSNILEGDIKNKAESEYKAISTTADVDLSKPINKDITITINLPNEKSKITNNIGSNILKFTENGEYIFNINIRGYDYTYKVTINNIDKTLPKLNIKNTGTSITATAADNNIKELNIEKDGKKITYSQGNEITNPGIYQIVAIDKAGNQTSSKEIIYGTFKNSNSQEEKYIPIDRTNTKVKNLVKDSDFTIKSEKNGTINSNNKEESNDVNVATGDKLVRNGQEYLLVVKGDITKDGEAGVLDLISLRKQLVSLEGLKDEQAIAADLDDNGKIDVLDLIMERKKIVGLE